MQDPYLPPGVTSTDIDINAGAVIYCDLCGRLFEPPDDTEDLCPKCRREEEE